jgi:hypothetical protein
MAMTDFESTDANGRSLANGMLLMGLLELLRDRGQITDADIRSIVDRADKTLSDRPNDAAVRGARPILEMIAKNFWPRETRV